LQGHSRVVRHRRRERGRRRWQHSAEQHIGTRRLRRSFEHEHEHEFEHEHEHEFEHEFEFDRRGMRSSSVRNS
jgi:hypothetical protein